MGKVAYQHNIHALKSLGNSLNGGKNLFDPFELDLNEFEGG